MPYKELLDKNHALEAEVQGLKIRLEEAEELRRAISEGDLDALIIRKPEEELVFTLDSADRAYRVLVETMNEGTATLASDGTILYCNRQFSALTKMPSKSVVGTSIYRVIAPQDAATFKALLKKQTGAGELELQAQDGTSVPVHLSISSLHSEESPNAWCLVVTDLTEEKKNEERYRSFIENFKGIAFQADENFIPVFMHGTVREITGYTEKDFMSVKPWKEIIHPEDLHSIYEEEERVRNSHYKDYGEIDFRIIHRDGKIKWVHEIYQKIPGHNKTPDSYQGAIYDITERKEAEEALAKLEKIRIKEIHHRIKNNLQVISSLLSLEAERFSDEKMLEALKESQNRVTSMALIHEELYKGDKNDTLDFAAYLFKFTVDLFNSYNLGNSNISLNTNLESVYLDMDTAVPLGIIINELISNSLKHAFPAGSDGEINISLHRTETLTAGPEKYGQHQNLKQEDSHQYILKVADNGKGIPEEIEIENADSLGLQLVNILIEQIDGNIELKKERGTEFSIFFQIKEP